MAYEHAAIFLGHGRTIADDVQPQMLPILIEGGALKLGILGALQPHLASFLNRDARTVCNVRSIAHSYAGLISPGIGFLLALKRLDTINAVLIHILDDPSLALFALPRFPYTLANRHHPLACVAVGSVS